MNIKIFVKSASAFILAISFLFIFSSCSKDAEVSLTDDQKNLEEDNSESLSLFSDSNLFETDEDLTSVDYKEFYNQLSPHGEWLQIRIEEIGMRINKDQPNVNPRTSGFSFSNLFSKESAASPSDENVDMIFIWKPSVKLAVAPIMGSEPNMYIPYTNGQWVHTDAGWYFKAPTPVEELVHHYGRWVNSPTTGWVWIPGRVWAPAWVDWKENDEFIAWAPIPASTYVVNDEIKTPVIDDDKYILVEKKDFLKPNLHKYIRIENKNKVIINEMSRTEGIKVKNHKIYNKGPEVSDIEKFWGNKIENVKINKVKVINDVKYSANEFSVFAPGFNKKVNLGSNRTTVSKPKSFVKFDEWKGRLADDSNMDPRKGNNNTDRDKKYDEKLKGNDDKRQDDVKRKDAGKRQDNKGKKDNDKGKRNNDRE